MSETGTETGAPVTSSNWSQIAGQVVGVVSALASFAVPGSAEAIAIGVKIVQGLLAAEPTAVALFDQIKSGTAPTPEQLQAFSDAYEADYQALHADIVARLASLPTT